MGNVYFLGAGGVSAPRPHEAGSTRAWLSSWPGRGQPSSIPPLLSGWQEVKAIFAVPSLSPAGQHSIVSVLSQWTIVDGWNVLSRWGGLTSRKIPVTKRALVTHREPHVWEHACGPAHVAKIQCDRDMCCWQHCWCRARLGQHEPPQQSTGEHLVLWFFWRYSPYIPWRSWVFPS